MAFSSLDPVPDADRLAGLILRADEAEYPVDRGKMLRLALAGALACGYLAHDGFSQIATWLRSGVPPEPRVFVIGIVVAVIAAFAIGWLIAAMTGLPRLGANQQGIELQTLFGVRRFAWRSLAPFELRSFVLPTGRQVFRASARIIGDEGGLPFGRRRLAIGNSFTRPLPSLVEALNSRRMRALSAAGFHTEAAEQPEEEIFGLAGFRQPYLTYLIMVLLLAIYFLEQRLALDGTFGAPLSYASLVAMGALVPLRVVYDGEWYRVLTAPLLHGMSEHVISNCVGLIWGGRVLERLVGRLWFLAILLLSALGSSLVTIALHPPSVISVGASGALMGMCATILVIGFREPSNSPLRHSLHVLALWMLVPSIAPYFLSHSDETVDYASHLGGALTGLIIGLILLGLWPRGQRIPGQTGVAAMICAVGMVLTVWSVALAMIHYQNRDADLIPVLTPGG